MPQLVVSSSPKQITKAATQIIREQLNRKSGTPDEFCQFSLSELRAALNKGKGRAPGIDNIQPEILRHLPTVGQEALIALLNRSWRTSEVPGCWKTAIVIPILKKGKPANDV